MQRFVKWLTPLITLGVAIFIIFLLIDVNERESVSHIEPIISEDEPGNKTDLTAKRWLDTLAQHERHGFFYPVNEIYVELDLDQRSVSEKTYRLSALLRDSYQLFCLKQELSQHQLRYTLKHEKKATELLVYSRDEAKIKAFLHSLKNYQITASILPYKEDLQWKNIK